MLDTYTSNDEGRGYVIGNDENNCDWWDVDCDNGGIHDEGGGYVIGNDENDCDIVCDNGGIDDEGGGYVIGNDRNDCDWCVDSDDEEIDDDIDGGTGGM